VLVGISTHLWAAGHALSSNTILKTRYTSVNPAMPACRTKTHSQSGPGKQLNNARYGRESQKRWCASGYTLR